MLKIFAVAVDSDGTQVGKLLVDCFGESDLVFAMARKNALNNGEQPDNTFAVALRTLYGSVKITYVLRA